ncbi:hypothetical protein EYF80_023207 [Liparis tanakae]|uniref:C2H2-type domain-containing protein n=1 Tax=Liparis tanakae TaxID=230148 RepID=A0A4Z2HLW6_9TELE|nr:hypothetical protein EYF80_023207 [Liparis tanakae]
MTSAATTSTRTTRQTQSEKRSSESTTSDVNADPTSNEKDGSTSGGSVQDSDNPYKCDRCDRVMTNFKNYKFHMKSHTVEKTFKCKTYADSGSVQHETRIMSERRQRSKASSHYQIG